MRRPSLHRAPGLALVAACTILTAACQRAPRSQAVASSPPCRADTLVVARVQRTVDSVARAHPEVPGMGVHVDAPAHCLSRTFVAGWADSVARRPFTPDTPLRLASNTKTYVAAAVLRLVEDGRVSLDDPIGRHIAPVHVTMLRADGYDPEAMRVRHLLTHTSGLVDHTVNDVYLPAVQRDPAHRWTRTEQLGVGMAHGTPLGPPGAQFRYSDTGYILLGELLERVTGLPLAAALRAQLDYARLGLADTWLESLEPPPAMLPPRAHQWYGSDDTFAWDPSLDLYGGGGLASPLRDMARFTRAVMTGRVYRRAATLDTMRTNLIPARAGSGPRARDFGMGLYATTVDGTPAWGHSGFWGTASYHLVARDVTIAATVLQARAPGVLPGLIDRTVAAVR